MNSINLSIKHIIWLILSIGISVFLVHISTVGITELAKNNEEISNTVISTLGNMSGGIIGGIVAYLVASYQIKKATDEQTRQHYRMAYSSLRILQEEIAHNSFILSKATEAPDFDQFKPLLSDKISNVRWEQVAIQIGPEISEATFKTLYKYYNAIFLLKDSNMATLAMVNQAFNLSNQLQQEFTNTLSELAERIK